MEALVVTPELWRKEAPAHTSSVKPMQNHPSARTPQAGTSAEIPDKLYFRIGDVARLCGVEAYVLRFWESEFPQLHPNKSGTGQRLYRKRDVELALKIKRLLYEEGYTIAGARQVFQTESKRPKSAQPALPGMANKQIEARIEKLRTELHELLGMLSTAPASANSNNSTSPEHRPRRLASRRLVEVDAPGTTATGPTLFDK